MKAGWYRKLSLLVFCVFLFGAVTCISKAQDRPDNKQQTAEQQDKANRGPHFGRELARDAREAAGEDENAQFKQSASVRKIAALTGMSLQHAYWLCLIINFAVVAGVIIWVSKKNLPGIFRARTAHIQQAMEEARKASAEANQR